MSDRQPLKATFFAFQKRDPGGVLLRASVGLFLAGVVLFGGLIVLAMLLTGASYGELIQASAGLALENPPPGMMFAAMAYIVVMFAYFVVLAAYEAACLRWLIRREVKGFLGLSFDADTWRVYGTYWLWVIMVIVLYIVLLIIFGIVIAAAVGLSRGGASWAWALSFVPLALLLAVVYFLVRFAPAAATSVGSQRFAFFSAWTVTKGRFWALFGSFFLLTLGYVLISCLLLGGWLVMAIGPSAADIFSQSDPAQASLAFNQAMAQAMASPAGLAIYVALQVVTSIIGYIFFIASYGVNARAVIAAADEGKVPGLATAGSAETFS